MSEFLKKMQEQLEAGEKSDFADKMKEIVNKSESMTSKEAEEKLEERLNEAGRVENDKSGDEMFQINEEYRKKMLEMKEESRVLYEVARISNLRAEIDATKAEHETVIRIMEEELAALTEKFENENGELKNYVSDSNS
jgi:single-stranded DNA-specific DHH superfamily exonuclease